MRRPRKGIIEHLEAGVYAVDMPNMYGNDKESTLLFVLNASSPLSLINSFKGIGTKNASLCQCTYPDENGVHRPTLQLAVEMDSDIKANTQVFVDYGMHFEFHKGTPPEFQKEHVESFCKDVNPATGRLYLDPVDYESDEDKKEDKKEEEKSRSRYLGGTRKGPLLNIKIVICTNYSTTASAGVSVTCCFYISYEKK